MAFTFKIKKRCRFCGTVLREDGTCPNEDCPRYVPEETEEPKQEETPVEQPKQETTAAEEPKQDSATDTNVGGK